MTDDLVEIIDNDTLEILDTCHGPVGGRCPGSDERASSRAQVVASRLSTRAPSTRCSGSRRILSTARSPGISRPWECERRGLVRLVQRAATPELASSVAHRRSNPVMIR